jgi:hypothetical protein
MKSMRPALLVVLLSTACAYGAGGYLYALNSPGTMSVNASTLNTYPSYFNPNNPSASNVQAWRDINIIAGNQYAIRGDGLVYLNGSKLWQLPYNNNGWIWVRTQYSNGTLYSLRTNGGLAISNTVVKTLPKGNYYFNDIQVAGTTTYCLRSDGSIYQNTGTTPIFVFHAGDGISGKPDGKATDTLWITLRLAPSGRFIYALRTDGILYRGDLRNPSSGGQYVTQLPFVPSSTEFQNSDIYYDLEFDELTGIWAALRLNGQVYLESDTTQPADDFPGDGDSNDTEYFTFKFYNGRYYALRADGSVYAQSSTNTFVKLPGSYYGAMQFSPFPPNLEGQSDFPPTAVQYTISSNTNVPLRLPVIAADAETRTENLVITPTAIPAGSVWNDATRELIWDSPSQKGNYTFSYDVTDEQGNKTSGKSKIQVKYPDLNPSKNKPPFVPKIKNGVAMAGLEYRLYIPFSDPDNDPVTVSVDATSYPFNAGATYDAGTSEFVWTPTNWDLGKHTLSFTLSDGVKTQTLKVKLEVDSPLLIVPLSL